MAHPVRARADKRPRGGLLGRAAILAILAALVAGQLIGAGRETVSVEEIAAAGAAEPGSTDPLAWDEERARELQSRAILGHSHVLYALSPGGAEATARRTAAWRPTIEEAAAETGNDPALMEAMVFLESAGRPQVIAGASPEAASGIAQIIPSAATELLGLEVDLERSKRLTERIERAEARAQPQRVERLLARRAEVDERFQPDLAIEAMGRYLEIGREHFGRTDLAVVSYHMGIGNLEGVLRAYLGAEESEEQIDELVAEEGLGYTEVFFNSSPLNNVEAYERLSRFADESSTYLWRVLAGEAIMSLWRSEPEELARIAELHERKATAEEVFHPPAETEVFETPKDVSSALADGRIVEIPRGPERLGLRIGPQLGRQARRLGVEPERYEALRPAALATLVYMAGRVRAISHAERPLTVTSAVRDRRYQESLAGRNPEATEGYSLHTTGWSFDLLRSYESRAQAAALQFALDRLRAQAVLDYAKERASIHVTVSELGHELLEAD